MISAAFLNRLAANRGLRAGKTRFGVDGVHDLWFGAWGSDAGVYGSRFTHHGLLIVQVFVFGILAFGAGEWAQGFCRLLHVPALITCCSCMAANVAHDQASKNRVDSLIFGEPNRCL